MAMNELIPGQQPEQPSRSYEIAAHLQASFGEELGFDDETVAEIAEMPFGDAFETAYGYLTQAGINADIALAGWLEPPED